MGVVGLVALACLWRWWAILPLAVYVAALWITALASTRSLKIASLAIVTSFVQLGSYGIGFIKAFMWKIVLRHGRDINEEIAIRKGK